jgi:hypothetical protein
MHHPNSLYIATQLSTSNEENQQPEHVSINTSTSESSSSSSSSENPTRKGWAFSVSGKEEAFRARARMEAQRKNELSSKSSFDDDASDDDSSDSNAAQPKTVKGWGRKLHAGRILLFSIGLECYLQPKTGQTIHTKKTRH